MSNLGSNVKKTLIGLMAASFTVGMFSCRPSGDFIKLPEIKTTALMVVPNKNRVDVLDTQTNRVEQILYTDDRPSQIAVSNDKRMVLVTNENSGTVSVFLRRDNSDFQQLNSVGQGQKPVGIAFNPNATISEAYVAYEGDKKVTILNTSDRNSSPKIVRNIPLQNATPESLVVSNDGSRIFITDSTNDRIVTLVRTGQQFTLNFSQQLNNGNPESVDLDGMIIDSQDRLFIANSARSEVFVFNGRTNQLLQTIPLQDNQVVGQNQVGPKNLTLYKNETSGQEKIYVTGHSAGVVSVIDPKANRLLKNILLSNSVQGRDSGNPVGVAVGRLSSGEDVIYVTNSSGLAVSLINPVNDTLLRSFGTTISSGAQDPYGQIVTIGAVR